MVCKCEYNPDCDLKKVVPFGAVDLVAAMKSGSVPSDIRASEGSYNDIDDPNSIGGRPADVFEEAQMSKVTVDYVPPKKNEE